MDSKEHDSIINRIVEFLEVIGIRVQFESITGDTFLPGIMIRNGLIVIDREKLLYPGDILHEAGHLAVMPPDTRNALNGDLDPASDLEMGGELMVIPWSYAAALHLLLDPAIVFHKDGYKGGSENILENFKNGRYFGLPMLQWIGLTWEPHIASAKGEPGFPDMIKWLRE